MTANFTPAYLKKFIALNSKIESPDKFYRVAIESKVISELTDGQIENFANQIKEKNIPVTTKFLEKLNTKFGANKYTLETNDSYYEPLSFVPELDRAVYINYLILKGQDPNKMKYNVFTPDLKSESGAEELGSVQEEESVGLKTPSSTLATPSQPMTVFATPQSTANDVEENVPALDLNAPETQAAEVQITAQTADGGPSPGDPAPDPNENVKDLTPEGEVLQTNELSKVEVNRYHPTSLQLFFGNKNTPNFDLILQADVLNLKISEEERTWYMDTIVEEFGKKMLVKKRKSTTLEEFNELIQLQFCIMRNLQTGNRYATANVKVSDLIKIANGGSKAEDQPTTFVPKMKKVQLSPGDLYVRNEIDNTIRYAPRVSNDANYL